jgi:AhpD family alkylhydroperoxidase
MPTLKLITEQEAQGEVKEMYEQIKKLMGGEVPPTFQVMANNPEYLKLTLQKLNVILQNGELDKKTKYSIGLAVSTLNNCAPCINMYTGLLKEQGVTEKQIVEILSVIDLVSGINHFNNGTIIKPQ